MKLKTSAIEFTKSESGNTGHRHAWSSQPKTNGL